MDLISQSSDPIYDRSSFESASAIRGFIKQLLLKSSPVPKVLEVSIWGSKWGAGINPDRVV